MAMPRESFTSCSILSLPLDADGPNANLLTHKWENLRVETRGRKFSKVV